MNEDAKYLTTTRLCRYAIVMQIYVNGESRKVPVQYTAAQLVQDMGLQGQRLAMEINLDIIPRSTYTQHQFRPDDRVEIVHAIGGG